MANIQLLSIVFIIKEVFMAHTKNWTEDGVYRKFTDEISPDEILKSNFELQADPRFEEINYIINDFTKVTKLKFTSNHTKIYASTDDIISSSKGNLKIAIVAVQDAHIALANNYRDDMLNKFFKCEIFKTIKEAEDWVKS